MKKILIVDDEESARFGIRKALTCRENHLLEAGTLRSFRPEVRDLLARRVREVLEAAGVSLRLAGAAAALAEWLAGSPFAGEVTPDRLLRLLDGVPEAFEPDPRPQHRQIAIPVDGDVDGMQAPGRQAAGIRPEEARVGVSGAERVHRVRQPSLFPDLLKKPAAHAAPENGIQQVAGKPPVIRLGRPGHPEAEVNLLQVLGDDLHLGR